ncbi:hypothetical protein KC338_g3219 [Hortaea werneckii]|nr:hypothetical protein KC338_g3219 [Hortaea werneckii]
MATTATHDYTQPAHFNFSAPASDMAPNAFWPWVGADLCDPRRDHKLQAEPWGNDTNTLVGNLYLYLTLARCSIMIGRPITPRAKGWMQVAVGRLLELLDLGQLAEITDEAKEIRSLLHAGRLLSDDAGWHLYKLAWHGSAPEEKGGIYCVRERELQLLNRTREVFRGLPPLSEHHRLC